MTVNPDEGMRLLYPDRYPDRSAPPAVSGELELGAHLAVALSSVAAAADRLAEQRDRARLTWQECHIIDIPPGQIPAAGTLDRGSDVWAPQHGWCWHVLMIPAELGAAGTNMSLYRDAPLPMNLLLSSTVSGLFEPRGLFLLPGRRLVWTSAGDSLTVSAGVAAEISLSRLPDYLMGMK